MVLGAAPGQAQSSARQCKIEQSLGNWEISSEIRAPVRNVRLRASARKAQVSLRAESEWPIEVLYIVDIAVPLLPSGDRPDSIQYELQAPGIDSLRAELPRAELRRSWRNPRRPATATLELDHLEFNSLVNALDRSGGTVQIISDGSPHGAIQTLDVSGIRDAARAMVSDSNRLYERWGRGVCWPT